VAGQEVVQLVAEELAEVETAQMHQVLQQQTEHQEVVILVVAVVVRVDLLEQAALAALAL
jgi:hypothetical protein